MIAIEPDSTSEKPNNAAPRNVKNIPPCAAAPSKKLLRSLS